MTVDDRTRLNLHRKLEAVLGHDDADTLMAHLPPVTWNEVATKGDLRASEVALRNDLERLGTQLRGEMQVLGSELRGEMQVLGTQLRGEMQVLGSELRGEMQVLGSELRTEMHVGFADLRTEFIDSTNRQIKWLVTFAAAWTAVLVSLDRLVP